MGLSIAEYRALTNKTLDRNLRKAKYHNVKVETEDGTFDSKAEERRWRELKLLEKGGEITAVSRQVRFWLFVGHEKVGVYVADFVYLNLQIGPHPEWVIEDRKGAKTPEYKRKRDLMRRLYGIRILET